MLSNGPWNWRLQEREAKMVQPSLELVQAFSGLSADPRGAKLVEWLRASLEDERAQNDEREGVMLHRGQGAAITLNEILKVLDNSEAIERRYEHSKRMKDLEAELRRTQ
jgi:hypothetical protein